MFYLEMISQRGTVKQQFLLNNKSRRLNSLIMTFAGVAAPKRAIFSDLKSSKATNAGRGGS